MTGSLAGSLAVLVAAGPRPAAGASPEGEALPLTYVAVGDSTGVGVGAREGGYVGRVFARLVRERPGSRLVNLSRSGATTQDALEAQLPRVRAEARAIVTIGVGANDLARGESVQVFGARFDRLVGGVQERTAGRVLLSNIPDVSLAPAVPSWMRSQIASRVAAFNAEIARIAARRGLVVCDIYGASRAELPRHPEYFSNDGFHPSDGGYELWAETVWGTLRALL